MRTIDGMVREIIDARVASGENAEDDLLGLLLGARDEQGEAMSRQQVRDEVVTLMLAGHETTANALTWLWYLLALHPEVREAIGDEVQSELGARVPTGDDIERLPWTTASLQEAMRLYPPAWVLEREASAEDELDGEPVPKGATVIFPVHLIHRDPRWWPDPDRFRPARFLPEATPPQRGTYLPFGAGRRSCVGANFALLEGTLIAALLTQRYTFDLPSAAKVVPSATVTLKPRGGLAMIARAL
jgi:cytochrome P450